MRLGLLLEASVPITVPWNYRTSLTRVIYRILKAGSYQYSTWLHEEGYRWQNRVYRLFVYSDLKPGHWVAAPEGLREVQWMHWQVSSPDSNFIAAFQSGLKASEDRFELFGTTVRVVDLIKLPPTCCRSGMIFRTTSPVAVSIGDRERSRHPIYVRADQPEFIEGLRANLIAKWQAFHQREWNGGHVELRVWNPKQKLIRVFDSDVRAWHVWLQMWGDEELIRFAYDAGLGIRNSQGFGMIEVGG